MQDNNETTILLVAERLSSLHSDVSDLRDSMKESMKEMSTAVTKLVQMEERQIHVVQAIERAMKAADDNRKDQKELEKRVTELEKNEKTNKQTSEWVKSVMYGAAGLIAMFVAKKVGLI